MVEKSQKGITLGPQYLLGGSYFTQESTLQFEDFQTVLKLTIWQKGSFSGPVVSTVAS